MNTRTMTEPEAWREIARRIAEGEWQRCGLCLEAFHLSMSERRIGSQTRGAMDHRVWSHLEAMGEQAWHYAFPAGKADVRVLAALFLALEAEDDARKQQD